MKTENGSGPNRRACAARRAASEGDAGEAGRDEAPVVIEAPSRRSAAPRRRAPRLMGQTGDVAEAGEGLWVDAEGHHHRHADPDRGQQRGRDPYWGEVLVG